MEKKRFLTLKEALKDNDIRTIFVEFLESEKSIENYLFWKEIEKFQNRSEEEQEKRSNRELVFFLFEKNSL